MTNLQKRLLLVVSYIIFTNTWIHAINLFSNGHTPYQIVIARTASSSEKTAAKELQFYLNQISGASFSISFSAQSAFHHIFVGYNPTVGSLTKALQPKANFEGFTYKTIGNDLVIYGGSNRGTMYGVFSFLERELGVRWYANDCIVVPKKNRFSLGNYDVQEKPFVENRYIDYHDFTNDSSLYAHNKMNFMWESNPNQYGNFISYWGCHTSHTLVSPKIYFKSHPEYFSLRNGKRIANGQLCLSNPSVLRIAEQHLAKSINTVINYWCYDVSQNDNELFCECSKCQALEKKYGGHSGIWIWFVNQIARDFPNIKIGTFAYRYTRQAPKNIKPRSNVVVRLCSIECCFSHPIESCPKNKSFLQDLNDWAKISSNLFVWDYIVDFNHYLLPYPNWHVLADNIKLFVKNNASTILEDGQYDSSDGEWATMRSWIVAKLLWNPNQDVDSLAKDFIYGYYGSAAPYVEQYYRLSLQLVRPDTHITCYQKGDHPIYTNEFIDSSLQVLDKALSNCKNATIRERVEKLTLQPLYLEQAKSKLKAVANGHYARLMKLLLKYRPYIGEGRPVDTFIQKQGYI